MAENVSRTSPRKWMDYSRAKKQESETQVANKTIVANKTTVANKTMKASVMINEVQADFSA